MDDSKIKEAFTRAKQDILDLKEQLELLSQETQFLRQTLNDILYHPQFLSREESVEREPSQLLDIQRPAGGLQADRQTNQRRQVSENPSNTSIPALNPPNPSIQQEIPALQHTESSTPAQNMPLEAPKDPFSNVSSGNRGVPADRQTDRQTDQQTQNQRKIGTEAHYDSTFQHMSRSTDSSSMLKNQSHSSILDISQAIDTLDQAKKDLRLQFKRLTHQEMEVFATIYASEEQGLIVDHALLAQRLSLTESSIRDYIQKLLKKGAPIIKMKENNKKILLKIDPHLKKVASLSTIQHLRDL